MRRKLGNALWIVTMVTIFALCCDLEWDVLTTTRAIMGIEFGIITFLLGGILRGWSVEE